MNAPRSDLFEQPIDNNRVNAALRGLFDAAQLSAAERALFEDRLGASMDGTQTAQARAFWARFRGQINTDDA